MTSKALSTLLAALSVGLLATACGDDGGGTGSASAGTETDPTTDTPSTSNPSTSATTMNMTMTSNTTSETDTMEPSTTDLTSSTTDDPTTGTPGGAGTFRINSLSLRDPHAFAPVLGDVTESNVNAPLNEALEQDDPEMPDGFLDLGFVLAFDPLDQTDGAMESFVFANSQCTAPVDSTSCVLLPMTMEYSTTYASQVDGECYAADPKNLSMYDDPPAAPEPTAGPCFVTAAATVDIVAGSFTLPLADAVVAARYVGDPAGNLAEGNIEGFVSTAAADATTVETPLGQMVLSDLLREEDMDGDGWMFHISFTAVPVDYE